MGIGLRLSGSVQLLMHGIVIVRCCGLRGWFVGVVGIAANRGRGRRRLDLRLRLNLGLDLGIGAVETLPVRVQMCVWIHGGRGEGHYSWLDSRWHWTASCEEGGGV